LRDDHKRLCQPLARAAPARWRKRRPDAPLDVIGTDSVLDLRAGDADVAIRYARTPQAIVSRRDLERFLLARLQS